MGKRIGANEVMELIKQLEPIRDQAVQDKESVIRIYSNFNSEKDVRITAFSKMVNVFNSVQLALTFLSKNLLNPNWWESINKTEIPTHDAMLYAKEFENFSKLGYVQFLFSTTESSIRVFLRALDPTACNGGMDPFKNVYDCLLRSKLSCYPEESVELLDLFRLIRNTVHNNGVYFHRRGGKTIIWRGESYKFKQAKAVDFVTWQFVFEVSDAIRSLMYTIVTDGNLRAIDHEITDPFSQRSLCE